MAEERYALSPVQEAVLAAVAYRDIFDFPPTAAEIHRFLPHRRCSPEEVTAALGSTELRQRLTTDGEHYALAGRDQCFATRHERRPLCAHLWRRALWFGRLLATVPFVEMIAVSGSLAAENPGDKADIDFFVMLRAGHLWRTRVLIRILRRLDFAIGTRTLCPNSMRTTAAMKLPFETLYVAQELMQMRPIYGYDRYREMIEANAWCKQFLPNANPVEPPESECKPFSRLVRSTLEALLDSRAGAGYEARASKLKIAQFATPGHVFAAYSPFAAEYEGLNIAFAQEVEDKFEARKRMA